jgi:K+-sensing histidine kinase KdpD
MFLKKSNQISSITPEEADALVRTTARLAYGYRQELIQEFVQNGQELMRQDSRNRLTKFLVLAAVAALVIWFIAK